MTYSLPTIDALDKASVAPDSISAKCNALFVRQILTSVFIEDSMFRFFTFITFAYISLHSSVTKSPIFAKIRASGKREVADSGDLGKNMRKSGQNIGVLDQNVRSRSLAMLGPA